MFIFAVTAYSPLGSTSSPVMEDPTVVRETTRNVGNVCNTLCF